MPATQEDLGNGGRAYSGVRKKNIGNASYLSLNTRELHKIKSIFENLQRDLNTEHRAGLSVLLDSIQLAMAGKSREMVCLRAIIIRP